MRRERYVITECTEFIYVRMETARAVASIVYEVLEFCRLGTLGLDPGLLGPLIPSILPVLPVVNVWLES